MCCCLSFFGGCVPRKIISWSPLTDNGERLKVMSFKVDKRTRMLIEKHAVKQGVTMSEFIRRAVLYYDYFHEDNDEVPRIRVVEVA